MAGDNTDGFQHKERTGSLTAPEDLWAKQLFSRRLIFVMGKGGVGKTTVSIALGKAAVRYKKKVLLLEIGDTDAIGSIFNKKILTEVPLKLSANIWGARVNPKAELTAYTKAYVNSGFIANRITKSRLFDYLAEATPGLKEVMCLGRIWRWERSKSEQLENTFDLIIVDAPATGHALSLLRLPDVLINMIRGGPLVTQIRRLQNLFKDHRKTCILLVTLPEELPANEAIEFYCLAQDELHMQVAATFINCVYPLLFDDGDVLQIKHMKDQHDKNLPNPHHAILETALRQIKRRNIQQIYIDRIRSKTTSHVKEIPFYFTNDLSLSEIEELL